MAKTFDELKHEWTLTAWTKCVTKDDAFDDGWNARDAEIGDLRSRIEAVRTALDMNGDWEEREDAIRFALAPADETKREG